MTESPHFPLDTLADAPPDAGAVRDSQPVAADASWDRGLAAFLAGPAQAIPFDFWDRPTLLGSRDPEHGTLATGAETAAARFWSGMASLLGLENLRRLLTELEESCPGQAVSTTLLEELMLARSGNPGVVDAFHRFVYGLEDSAPAPELWLRDAVGDTGADHSSGTFWDSPDLWVRNRDDGGEAHQSPQPGQDNWFHARVRNKAAAGPARHFVVSFRSRGFAGTQFAYPLDFFPCTAAAAAFDLASGETRVVKARWPRALVPPPGTPTCLLASIITRADHPVAGRHPWEHNNLAQKSLSIVTLLPEQPVSLPLVLGNWLPSGDSRFELELVVPHAAPLQLGLTHTSRDFFAAGELAATELQGGDARGWRVAFTGAARHVLPITLAPFSQTRVGVELTVPRGAKPTNPFKVHLVQRNPRTRNVVGGAAIEVTIRAEPQAGVTKA